jgi:oligo-1,6-glucosidase
MQTTSPDQNWWKEAVVYQIYPRSFKDSNADGIGDLQGIISKLDYLADLGVDVIWLSPFYKSPNADNGYDISDYQDVMTEFGTLADFDELLAGIHARKMKLIIDLVVNHSSDEHFWFQESRKSKDNPYRDYYIWKPAKADGTPPNNWRSFFSGSAWQFEKATEEYYLHLFAVKQPDLNWENPKLREEVYSMMHFWLKKGVDGFRMDVIPFLSKDLNFPDFNGDFRYYANGPRIHEFLQEMNQKVLKHYDILTVGEGFGVGAEQANLYVGKSRGELNMIFHFDYIGIDRQPNDFFQYNAHWQLSDFKKILNRWDAAIGQEGWNSFYWGNHDNPRAVSRFGNDTRFRVESAKMLAVFLMTQRATPYIYQGDEFGMTNTPFERIEEFDDIQVRNAYKELLDKNTSEEDIEKWLDETRNLTRDHARTPVQWTNAPLAGFTDGPKTWLKVNPNFSTINAQQASSDENSVLSFYKQAIAVRKKYTLLTYGSFTDLTPTDEHVYMYTRTRANETFLIVCNFTGENQTRALPKVVERRPGKCILSNYAVKDESLAPHNLELRPYEACIFILE